MSDLPAGVQLRAATAADLPAVARLIEEGALADDGLASRIEQAFVAEAGPRLVGAIAIERLGDDALLRLACVEREWQARGVGSALVERALTEAALAALDQVFLVTTGSDRFFARFGFMPVERADLPLTIARALDRERAGSQDVVTMRLTLSGP